MSQAPPGWLGSRLWPWGEVSGLRGTEMPVCASRFHVLCVCASSSENVHVFTRKM